MLRNFSLSLRQKPESSTLSRYGGLNKIKSVRLHLENTWNIEVSAIH